MKRADTIRAILEAEFSPARLVIHDDSEKHAGHMSAPADGESHFRIEIVSKKFANLSPVARHRLVNDALSDLFRNGLHALSIQARDN